MKGLALEVVWGLIIAIVGVLVFLGLVTGTFKNMASWFYCSVYMKIIGFFGSSDMASIPEQCKGTVKGESKEETIKEEDNKIVSRKLLAYIIACWDEASLKGLYESHPCYELKLSGNVENVSEENVTSILINEDRCRSIENSDFNEILDYDCGEKNQILWSVDGAVSNLTKINISEAINNFTDPSTIPVDESMLPTIDNIKTTSQLKTFLIKDVPESICNSLGDKCSYWRYNQPNNYVWFKITKDGVEETYAYFVDMIMSDLVNKGFISSVISDQKIILISYNGNKEAVEVTG
jgi:hypothetical protein